MISSWDWKAIDLHFRSYQIIKFPIKWNPFSKTFSFQFENPWEYWPWFFTFYVLRLSIGNAGLLVLFFHESSPLFLQIVVVLMFLLSFGFCVLGTLILLFGEETVNAFNCLVAINNHVVYLIRNRNGKFNDLYKLH